MWRSWFSGSKGSDSGRVREPLLEAATPGLSSRASSVDFTPVAVRAKFLGGPEGSGFQRFAAQGQGRFGPKAGQTCHDSMPTTDGWGKAGPAQQYQPQLPVSNHARMVGVSGTSTPALTTSLLDHDMGAYQPLLEPLLDIEGDSREAHQEAPSDPRDSNLFDFDQDNAPQPMHERRQSSRQATTSGNPFAKAASIAALQVTSPSRATPARSLSKRSLLRILSHVSPQLGAALGGPPLETCDEHAEHAEYDHEASKPGTERMSQSPRSPFVRQLSSTSSRFSDNSHMHSSSHTDNEPWLQDAPRRTDSPRSSQRSMRIARRSTIEQSCQTSQDTALQAQQAALQQEQMQQQHIQHQQQQLLQSSQQQAALYQAYSPQHSRHASLLGLPALATDDFGLPNMPPSHISALHSTSSRRLLQAHHLQHSFSGSLDHPVSQASLLAAHSRQHSRSMPDNLDQLQHLPVNLPPQASFQPSLHPHMYMPGADGSRPMSPAAMHSMLASHHQMAASASAAAEAGRVNDKLADAARMWKANQQWIVLWLVLSVLTCIHAGALVYTLGWRMVATVCGAMFSWSGLLGVIGAVRTLLGHCLSRHVDAPRALACYKLKMMEVIGFMTASLSLLAMLINMFSFQIILHDPHMPNCPPPDAACQNSYNMIVITMVGTIVLYGCHGLVSSVVTYKAHAVRQIVRSVSQPAITK